MAIFTWIVLGIAGVLMTVAAVLWGLHVALDNTDWRRLAVKVFRIGLVFLLFYINAYIYLHLFGAIRGDVTPPAKVEEAEAEPVQVMASEPAR